MNQILPLNSEEDIRAQIILWLKDHGFNSSNTSLEYSFEIRLGRNIYEVRSDKPVKSSIFRPRADILVRSCDGRNFLIVEVKNKNEKLDENVKKQGICYAHLLNLMNVLISDRYLRKGLL